MPLSKQEIEQEIRQIRDDRFDLKKHFPLIFSGLLKKTLEDDKIEVLDSLVSQENWDEHLNKPYEKPYVLMFYSHKPSSSVLSPHYPNEPAAHTSLLLGTVKKGKVNHIINIDGYHFPSYVNPLLNPQINEQLIIKASGSKMGNKTPLQTASWENMNCVLYAFTFAEQILELFRNPENNVDELTTNFALLEAKILQGMIGKYIDKSGYYDHFMSGEYNGKLREKIAMFFLSQQPNSPYYNPDLLADEIEDIEVLNIPKHKIIPVLTRIKECAPYSIDNISCRHRYYIQNDNEHNDKQAVSYIRLEFKDASAYEHFLEFTSDIELKLEPKEKKVYSYQHKKGLFVVEFPVPFINEIAKSLGVEGLPKIEQAPNALQDKWVKEKLREIKSNFIRKPKFLNRHLISLQVSQEDSERLIKGLLGTSERLFLQIKMDSSKDKVCLALKEFVKDCDKHIDRLSRKMNIGFLYRAVEGVVKAIVGVFLGFAMVLGSVIGQGFANQSHREKYMDTFFGQSNRSKIKAILTALKQENIKNVVDNIAQEMSLSLKYR